MLYAILLKLALLPIISFGYWIVAIKGGAWIASLATPKWREFLTKDRYF